MSEVRESNPAHEAFQQDRFSATEKVNRVTPDQLSLLPTVIALQLGLNKLGAPNEAIYLSIATFASLSFGMLGLNFRDIIKQDKMEKENIVTNSALGGVTEFFLYSGKRPLETQNLKINQGDGVVAVTLPELATPTSSEDLPQALVEDYYDASLKAARDVVKDKPYKFVAINKPKNNIIDTPETDSTTPTKLTDGKRLVIKDGNQEVFLLTRQEFEDLNISPSEGLEKLQQVLGHTKLNEGITLLRAAKSPEQQATVKREITTTLKQIIQRELNIQATPQAVIDKKALSSRGNGIVSYREKATPSTRIIPSPQGGLFIETFLPGVGFQRLPIERVLKTSGFTIDEIIKSRSEYQTAQLAYMMYQMLQNTKDINELVRERVTDPLEVKKKLEELGVIKTTKQIFKVDNLKSRLKESTKLHRRGRTILATALIWAGIQGGNILLRHPDMLSHLSEGKKDTTTETLHQPGFPEGLPARHLDWEIVEKGLSSSGYYITETASDYKDGKWVVTTERDKKVSFDKTIPDDQPQLVLNRTQSTETTKFKLPIRNGTNVAALNITGTRNLPVPYEAYILKDGTVQVNLVGNRALLPPNVTIRETLVVSDVTEKAPHATPSDIHINEGQLNPNALFILKNIKDIESDENKGVSTTAYVIQKGRKYSLAPSNRQFMTPLNTSSPTDYFNTFSILDGASCDLASGAAVIVGNSVKGPGESDLNLALGYLNGTGSLASPTKTQFLRSDLAHAFVIDKDGNITDPTPTTLADDPLTQAYAKQLEGTPGGVSDEELWNKQYEEIIQKGNAQEQLVLLGELIGGGVAGFFALRQSSRLMKRILQKESIADIPDRAMLKLFSDPKELQKAYNFYSWISYGNTKEPALATEVALPESEKSSEVISKFQQHMNIERLGMYAEHPGKYEKLAKLTVPERMKMRLFANYLLS